MKIFDIFILFLLQIFWTYASQNSLREETTALLSQHDKEELSLKSRPRNIKGVALTGGGFRAFAALSGTLAGLAGSVRLHPQDGNQTAMKKLFANVDRVAGSSGGSWFLASLAYSKNFVSLLTEIGRTDCQKNVKKCVDLYDGKWTQSFTSNMKGMSMLEKIIVDAIGEALDLLDKNTEETAKLFLNLLVNGPSEVTWTNLAKRIVEVPGDLDSSKSLAEAPAAPWANSKEIFMFASLLAPNNTGSITAYGTFRHQCVDDEGKTANRNIRYQVKDPYAGYKQPPQFLSGPPLPITFNVKIGDSPYAETPIPFFQVAAQTLPDTIYHVYDESILNPGGKLLYSISPASTDAALFGMHSNKVSIAEAAAASSGFFGETISFPLNIQGTAKFILEDLDLYDWALNLSVRVAAAGPSVISTANAFDAAIETLRMDKEVPCSSWAHQVAMRQIMTLADGGFIDDSGLSSALAGANDGDSFTLIVNTNSVNMYYDFEHLFTGPQFNWGPGVQYTHMPVFAESQGYAAEQLSKHKKLQLAAGSSFVTGISYGSMTATTIDQPFFGVTAGKKVTLNYLYVNVTVDLVPSSDWLSMANCVAEIAAAFQKRENAKAVSYILNNYFKV